MKYEEAVEAARVQKRAYEEFMRAKAQELADELTEELGLPEGYVVIFDKERE